MTDYMRLEDVPGEIAKKELENAHKEIQELRLMDYALDIAPIKQMSNDERQSMRAGVIWWKLGRGKTITQPAEARARNATDASFSRAGGGSSDTFSQDRI